MLSQRDVNVRELSPGGWAPLPLDVNDGDPEQYRDAMQSPFCLWLIFQRTPDFDDSHGPYRFSLLYLCMICEQSFAVISPGKAYSSDDNMFIRMTDVTSSLNDFMNLALFCSSVGVFLSGVAQYIKYRENPGSITMGSVFATFAASAALMLLVYIPMPTS